MLYHMKCSEPGCDRTVLARGLCRRHYRKILATQGPIIAGSVAGQVCASPGCGRPVLARGYCKSHYRRLRRGGDVTAPLRPDLPAEIREYIQIPSVKLPRYLGEIFEAEVARRNVTAYHLVQEIVSQWAAKQATAAVARQPPPPPQPTRMHGPPPVASDDALLDRLAERVLERLAGKATSS